MPYISRPVSRRTFTRTLALAGFGVLAIKVNARDSAHIAFLSDTHVPADTGNNYRGFFPYKNFENAVKLAAAQKPEATVISGDLARLEGLPGDYQNLQKLLKPLSDRIPVGLSLGNHDNRDNFLGAFPTSGGSEQNVNGKHVAVMDFGAFDLLILDSLLYINRVAGLLGKAQRSWLSGYLDNSAARPVLLVFHHPPSDEDGDLHDSDRLFSIIKNRKNVKALIYGHSHEYRLDKQDGIHLINLPATAYNFDDNEPIGWVDAELNAQSGHFTLRTIGGNQALNGKETEFVWR